MEVFASVGAPHTPRAEMPSVRFTITGLAGPPPATPRGEFGDLARERTRAAFLEAWGPRGPPLPAGPRVTPALPLWMASALAAAAQTPADENVVVMSIRYALEQAVSALGRANSLLDLV